MGARAVLIGIAAGLIALSACGRADDESAAAVGADGPVDAAAPAQESGEAAPPPGAAEPVAELLEQDLAYGEGADSNLVGYLAMPADAVEPLPGLIVIHEWWGLDDDVRSMTRRLAAEGYVALAVDLYGGSVAETADQAQALMSDAMARSDATLANLRQAYEYLEKYAFAPAVGAVGWSFGGGWALRTAVAMPEQLDAAVVYYGQLIDDEEQLAALDVPILGVFAALDESIPVRDVQRFRSRLRALGKAADIRIYPDVGHAFAGPSGDAYSAEAAAEAWALTIEFLEANL